MSTRISYEIAISPLVADGPCIVYRSVVHTGPDGRVEDVKPLMKPGSKVRPWKFANTAKAREAIERALEKDVAACTRMGMKWKGEQFANFGYIDVP